MQPQEAAGHQRHAFERPRQARHLVQDHVTAADPFDRGARDRAIFQQFFGAAGVFVKAQHQPTRLAAVVVEAAQQRQHQRVVPVLVFDMLGRPRLTQYRMAAPEQEVGKAQARAIDRGLLRLLAAQFKIRIALAIVPDLPQAAVAALGRPAERQARLPTRRPWRERWRLARTPGQLSRFVQPEQAAVVAERTAPAAGRQIGAGKTLGLVQVEAQAPQVDVAGHAGQASQVAPHHAGRGDDG
jgi:hypothetical protein